jgi:hypothetical protein
MSNESTTQDIESDEQQNLTRLPRNIRGYISPHRNNLSTFDELKNESQVKWLNINTKLEHLHCRIKSKILIQDESEEVYIRFIKCSTINGGIVYFEIETDILNYENDDRILRRIETNSITHSRKYGDFHSCVPETDGVILEHLDRFVVIKYDKNTSPYESSFSMGLDLKKNREKPKSYPLVKLYNFYSHPSVLTKNISICFNRLLKTESEICVNDIVKAKNNLKKLNSLILNVEKKYNLVLEGFNDDNSKLEKGLIDSNEKMNQSNDSKIKTILRDKINRLGYNLSTRKECLKDLCNLVSIFNVLNDEMTPLIEDLSKLNLQLNEYQSMIGIVQKQ